MAGSLVQHGNSTTTKTSSGVAWHLGSNVLSGSALVCSILVSTSTAIDAVSSVTGCGGTWQRAYSVLQNDDYEIWYCLNATGGSTAITVTLSEGSGYWAQATEWSGNLTSVIAVLSGSTGPSIDQVVGWTPEAAGNPIVILAATDDAYNSFSGSPWSDENAGLFTLADGQDVAWTVSTSASPFSATWVQPGSVSYMSIGIELGYAAIAGLQIVGVM